MVSSASRLALPLLLIVSLAAHAQVAKIGPARPSPKLTIGDTITVSASPSAVTFLLVSKGVALASSPIVVTTTWSGVSLLSSLNLYAYFTSSTAALSGSTPVVNIPSANVLGKDTTGIPTSFTSFTQSIPVGGASLQLYSTSSILSLGGNHVDNLTLEIDLTSLPQLPAATYSGVLLLQAQAL
ncbi:MAG: hypothetical protein JSS95_12110 [Acidobacteria bacterium]|nr:hypothetical protein [Acidobacteriota bacterium]